MSAMPDITKLPGLKERELVKLGACAICEKPMLDPEKGGPTFYRIALTRAMFDQRAINRRVGLELQLGSGPLARAMGPDEDIAKIFSGPTEVAVHEGCAGQVYHLLRLLPAGDVECDDG